MSEQAIGAGATGVGVTGAGETGAGVTGVGVIGVGAMGGGIAARLVERGLRAWGRDIDAQREASAREQGVRIAGSAREIGAACGVVIVVVVDAAQIETVLGGADGLLGALAPASTVLLCSTIGPDDMAGFCRRVAATGAAVLDAPISGGPARARDGSMSMMLAGSPDALARADPVLRAISGKRFVIGERHGDASRAKLVNNLMAGIHLFAGAEAMALAERVGLDPRAMLDLVSASSGQSWIFDDRMPRALAGDYAPRAQTRVLTKDLLLANALASGAGVDLPLGAITARLFASACEQGWADHDDAAVLEFYRARFAAHMPE